MYTCHAYVSTIGSTTPNTVAGLVALRFVHLPVATPRGVGDADANVVGSDRHDVVSLSDAEPVLEVRVLTPHGVEAYVVPLNGLEVMAHVSHLAVGAGVVGVLVVNDSAKAPCRAGGR